MELITKKMYMMERKCEAVSQITFDEDLNVPDVKPDIGRMIQKKGEIQIDDIQISQGKAYLSGALVVYLLYVSDGPERKIYSLMGNLPIGETMNLEGLENGDKVQVKWDIEDLSIQLINSRKLNMKALVTFTAYVEDFRQVEIPLGVEDSDISQKKQEVSIMSTAVHKKDIMRIKEDIALSSNKPDIYELLWDTVEVRGLDIRAENDKTGVKGELFLFALYRGNDDNNSLQWLEHSVPFYQEVECSGCTPDMIPNVIINVPHSELKVKQDIMSTAVHKKDIMRIKEDIALSSNKPDIYELLWDTVEVRGLDIRAENDKTGVKGELFLFALYRGNDDNNSLQWLEHSVPFYQEVECSGCTPDMIPNVIINVPHSELKVKQDDDGEDRILSVDTALELEMKIYEEEDVSLLMDVYTPVKDCRAIRKNYKLESLLVKNFSKCKVNDRVKAENCLYPGKRLQGNS